MLYYAIKSKFVRSVFLRVVSIFLIVMLAIIGIVFYSFTSEIEKNIISERQKQLETIEATLSKRMEEISGIAYHVGNDKTFFLESVSDSKYSGEDMSRTLSNYLVGNDFVEHLAFYRLSEPDTLYVSIGELGFHDFWSRYLHVDKATADELIRQIQQITEISMKQMRFDEANKEYFCYVCPLPQFSKTPQAFVLMMIPCAEVESVLATQLTRFSGEIAVFDADGKELSRVSTLTEDIPITLSDQDTARSFSANGQDYMLQQTKSPTNGWTYVSVIRLNDMISKVANKQLVFIVLLLAIMFVAIIAMLVCIIVQYNPISKLALSVQDKEERDRTVIDEQSLLSNTFATLRDDSDQKQKFEAAYYAAESANKAKSTFLSNMSHDIRTPMNAIMGLNEIAIKHTDDPQLVADCLQKVRVASQYLLDIINNVLDMSRIESGKFTLSEDLVELPKLVYGMITILNQTLSGKNQRFLVSVADIQNEKIIGDGVRLTQVFMNILSNSVKFTPDGGTIRLSMHQTACSEAGYGDYVFVFDDSGIGMSPEFTAHVFDTFTRDETSDVSKIEGTGLGMAIAKNLVELMGGTISCESTLGAGTTFTVKMHLRLAAEKADNGIYGKYRDTSVLIVGAEEQLCVSQTALFTALGAKATYALGPAAACKTLREMPEPCTFVLIEPTDADKNGVQTVTTLRAAASDKTTFLLTAIDLFSIDHSAAQNAGIAAFVQLPLFRSTARGVLDRTLLQTDATGKRRPVNLAGMRVLLVEDHKLNRQIARMLISETHAEIVEATNGKEALELFSAHTPHYFNIILMDVRMPLMNGYEATAAIRALPRADAKEIPIIAMTANTLDEDVQEAKQAGMTGHLSKPYESKELYRILLEAYQA